MSRYTHIHACVCVLVFVYETTKLGFSTNHSLYCPMNFFMYIYLGV